jgi:protein-tyrosine phosphatase
MSNVLIHCHIGASRSVAIVMAYLIRKYSYSLPQIYSIIKRKRSLIQPNPGFIKQLEEYSQLYSVRST